MKEHTGTNQSENDYEFPSQERMCNYYKYGCQKGDLYNFKHQGLSNNLTPLCNRGQGCNFFAQNRCRYFHHGVGVQQGSKQQKWNQTECRFKENCWNIETFSFSYPNQGFHFMGMSNRHP